MAEFRVMFGYGSFVFVHNLWQSVLCSHLESIMLYRTADGNWFGFVIILGWQLHSLPSLVLTLLILWMSWTKTKTKSLIGFIHFKFYLMLQVTERMADLGICSLVVFIHTYLCSNGMIECNSDGNTVFH